MLSGEDRTWCEQNLRKTTHLISSAHIAIDNGNIEEAIRYLQEAEVTMGRAKMYLGLDT